MLRACCRMRWLRRSGLGPNNSRVFAFGVAVKATKVMPLSASARLVICAAARPRADFPPSSSSLLGCQHLLQLAGALACLRTVRLIGDHGIAFAFRRRKLTAPSLGRTGRSESCRRRSSCRRTAPRQVRALAAALALMLVTTPVVRSKSKIASCSCPSITLRSLTTSTESKTFLWSASWSSARKCAVHAIEFVLPEPAECWIRYLPPAPSSATARSSLRVAS